MVARKTYVAVGGLVLIGLGYWFFDFCTNPVDSHAELLQSIRRGDLPAMRSYLARGGSPLATIDVRGKPMSLLQVAIVDREEAIALALMEAGATLDPNGDDFTVVGTNGLARVVEKMLPISPEREIAYTGVGNAADNGYNDVVQVYLLHQDDRVSEWRKEYGRAANGAMLAGYDDTARLLLEAGADLSETLHTAARFSSPGMVRYLLERGISPTEGVVIPGVEQKTPIDFAWLRYRSEVAYRERLAASGRPAPNRERDSEYVLYELIRAGAVLPGVDLTDIAKDGLAELAAIDGVADRLVAAARLGFFDEVNSLIDDTQVPDADTLRTAVIQAFQNDHDDIARMLLMRGAPVDGGVLHVASSFSSPGMVRYLLVRGAGANELFDGKSPLQSWFDNRSTLDAEFILHELIVGGADACWLVSRRDQLPGFSAVILRDSALKCWDEALKE